MRVHPHQAATLSEGRADARGEPSGTWSEVTSALGIPGAFRRGAQPVVDKQTNAPFAPAFAQETKAAALRRRGSEEQISQLVSGTGLQDEPVHAAALASRERRSSVNS